jgi:RNA polymerase sigma-70 factor (ECF subfamily)
LTIVGRAVGDAERFEALWAANAHRVQAYALRHVEADTAQDVVAETFLVAWRRLADVPAEPLPWLIVVARNIMNNHRRSLARAHQLHAALAYNAGANGNKDLDVVDDRDVMFRALTAMAPLDREAVLLTAWDGLRPDQAAEVQGCSTAAFKMRLSRARKRLTDLIAAGSREETRDLSTASRRNES